MIKEFDLVVFRRKFWVAVDSSKEEISSLLGVNVVDEKYSVLSDDIYNSYKNKSNAITVRAYNLNNGDLGYLVILFKKFDKGSELVDAIAHESCHVSDFLQEDIGVQNGDTEINGHITGYVAGKIMLTWNEKDKEND